MSRNLLLRCVVKPVVRGGRWVLSRRNFSSYGRGNELALTSGEKLLVGGAGLSAGSGYSYLYIGDHVARCEEIRQEGFGAASGRDIREVMWPELWSDIKEGKFWSEFKATKEFYKKYSKE